MFLTTELRADRYRSYDTVNQRKLYYKDYEILHLGASFKASEAVTFNARVNNLLDRDFKGYDITFTECATTAAACARVGDEENGYQAAFLDHYNNIDKARNFWVGVNVRF